MHIVWKGQFCFEFITAYQKGKQISIIVDPYSAALGLKPLKLKGDILLVTHKDSNINIKTIFGEPFLIDGPGEYEIKEVFIQGISINTIIYTIEAEGMKICHLGNFKQKELTSDQLEKIGEVDILIIPVGGVDTINSREAPKLISQIEPKLVIPMSYKIPKLNPPAGGKLEGVDKFLKAMGQKSIEPQNKLTIRMKDLSEEEAKIILLKPS